MTGASEAKVLGFRIKTGDKDTKRRVILEKQISQVGKRKTLRKSTREVGLLLGFKLPFMEHTNRLAPPREAEGFS